MRLLVQVNCSTVKSSILPSASCNHPYMWTRRGMPLASLPSLAHDDNLGWVGGWEGFSQSLRTITNLSFLFFPSAISFSPPQLLPSSFYFCPSDSLHWGLGGSSSASWPCDRTASSRRLLAVATDAMESFMCMETKMERAHNGCGLSEILSFPVVIEVVLMVLFKLVSPAGQPKWQVHTKIRCRQNIVLLPNNLVFP